MKRSWATQTRDETGEIDRYGGVERGARDKQHGQERDSHVAHCRHVPGVPSCGYGQQTS